MAQSLCQDHPYTSPHPTQRNCETYVVLLGACLLSDAPLRRRQTHTHRTGNGTNRQLTGSRHPNSNHTTVPSAPRGRFACLSAYAQSIKSKLNVGTAALMGPCACTCTRRRQWAGAGSPRPSPKTKRLTRAHARSHARTHTSPITPATPALFSCCKLVARPLGSFTVLSLDTTSSGSWHRRHVSQTTTASTQRLMFLPRRARISWAHPSILQPSQSKHSP